MFIFPNSRLVWSMSRLLQSATLDTGRRDALSSLLQGVCWQSAKAKLKNRHFTGGYRGSKPFFLTLQTGLKFPVDKRNIKDVY